MASPMPSSSTLDSNAKSESKTLTVLIWRLGVGCVFLVLLVGATYNWEHGSGQHSAIVAAIAGAAWLCYAVECPRFDGHLSAASSDAAGRMSRDGKEEGTGIPA